MITLNITKSKYIFSEDTLDAAISEYYSYCNCNNYSSLCCPLCKIKNTLSYYKSYTRNITYYDSNANLIKNTTINITVLKCNHCNKLTGHQKYHALLPSFIFPYHIYLGKTILLAIKDYFDNQKIMFILNKLSILHKLLYDWLKKFNIYLLSSSIILKEKNNAKLIINKIYLLNNKFLIDFFNFYFHPYFLFKRTCVPLCINF